MDTPKLQAYASLAEVVSAVAIIVSLLYAANEFHRAGTISSRQADGLLFQRVQEANRLLIEGSDLAEIVVTARTAPESLSAADRLRYLAYQHDFFDSWEIGWDYHADGILEDESWREWDRWFTAEARRRPRFAWQENLHHYTGADFRRHVEEVLAADR